MTLLIGFASLTSCGPNSEATTQVVNSSQRSRVVDFINAQPGMWGDPSIWADSLGDQGIPISQTSDLYPIVVNYIEANPNDQSGWVALKKLNNSLAGQNEQQHSLLQQRINTSSIPSDIRWQHGY